MIIAFTGAGISKASNIPTFMERPNIREKLHRSYAIANPEQYNQVIASFLTEMKDAQPNDGHLALAEYDVPVITMNIDGLHEQAGSEVLALHGSLPSKEQVSFAHTLYNQPVLYGDPAPNYARAFALVQEMQPGDIFLVIGASHHTIIASDLRQLAQYQGASIVEIQADAETQTRKILQKYSAQNTRQNEQEK